MTETTSTNTAPKSNAYNDMLLVQAALRYYSGHLAEKADKVDPDGPYVEALRKDAVRALALEKTVTFQTAALLTREANR